MAGAARKCIYIRFLCTQWPGTQIDKNTASIEICPWAQKACMTCHIGRFDQNVAALRIAALNDKRGRARQAGAAQQGIDPELGRQTFRENLSASSQKCANGHRNCTLGDTLNR